MTQPPSIELIELRDLKPLDAARYQQLFHAFVALYAAEFTDGSEREDPAGWHARLAQLAPPQPRMYLTLACQRGADGGQQVLGGVAYELYRESRCALVTYLVVSPTARGRGCGRRLLAAAGARLERDTAGELRAVFAESELPDLIAEPDTRARARERLAILAALGARKLPIAYVQPQLEGGSGRARHLMLLQLKGGRRPTAAAELRAFLDEFYRALGVADPAADADYRACVDGLVDPLVPLALEAPLLRLRDVSLCLHFLASDQPDPPLSRKTQPPDACPIMGSMERDLLSFSYQDDPEFVSYCLSHGPEHDRAIDSGEAVEVAFPEVTRFRSEGRSEQRFCGSTRRRLHAYLSRTIFIEAGVSVWHLCLRPAPGEWLDELDLIKLMQLYDGRTEGSDLHRQIRFRHGERELLDAAALVGAVAERWGFASNARARPVAGTLQLIEDEAEAGGGARAAASLLALLAPAGGEAARERCATQIAEHVSRADATGRRLLAMCGLISGIFDFPQIDAGEAADTLAPTVATPGSFLRVDRRSLVQIASEDRSLRSVAGSVGISPYLIVPHALLIFDDDLAEQADRAAERVLREREPTIAALEAAREDMNRALRGQWLSNVFHYQTERTLFDAGQAMRGTHDRSRSLQARLTEIESNLTQAWELRRQRNETVISILLALISIAGFGEPLHKLLALLLPGKAAEPLRQAIDGTILGAFLLVVVLASLRSLRSARDRRRARDQGRRASPS